MIAPAVPRNVARQPARIAEAEKSMPRQTPRKTTRAASVSIRDQIKRVTTELLVKHGFRGTNFRAIATRLKTTTTNIHYHFGNKSALVEEVVQDYVTDASRRQMLIWLDGSASLSEKLRREAALNYQRYKKFNRGAHTNRPWSLIGRLRLEMDVLTSKSVAALASFTTDVRAHVRAAVHAAAEKNELRSEAPLDKLAGLLGSIVDSASVLSQDAKSFESSQSALRGSGAPDTFGIRFGVARSGTGDRHRVARRRRAWARRRSASTDRSAARKAKGIGMKISIARLVPSIDAVTP